MANEVRLFVTALRNGEPVDVAFRQYCIAKSAVPIRLADLEMFDGDPYRCPIEYYQTLSAVLKSVDTFDDGADDDAIIDAWNEGAEYDFAWGIRWRPMSKKERPSPGELIHYMSQEEREKAVDMLGVKFVASQWGEFLKIT